MRIVAALKLACDELPSASNVSIERSLLTLKGDDAVVINSIVAGFWRVTGCIQDGTVAESANPASLSLVVGIRKCLLRAGWSTKVQPLPPVKLTHASSISWLPSLAGSAGAKV